MFWLARCGWGLFGLGFGLLFARGLMMLLFWAAVAMLIVLLLRSRREYPPRAQAAAGLDILNARYARGEISKAEYDQIRHDLER